MIKLFWWRDSFSLKHPRSTLAQVFKRVFHYKLPLVFYNFGDELSPAIIAKLSGQEICFSRDPGKIVSLGSILHYAQSGDSIWGTGLLKKTLIPKDKDIKICSVRGPRTREVLINNGYDCPAVYGDPALLSPYLWKRENKFRYKVGIIPHWSQIHVLHNQVNLDDPSIKVINVSDPWDRVLQAIQSCEVIVSSSLHGLILADSYGIPRTMYYLDEPPNSSWFKYEDYSYSINTDFQPLKASMSLADIVKLSEKATLNPVNKEIVAKMLDAAPFELSKPFSLELIS